MIDELINEIKANPDQVPELLSALGVQPKPQPGGRYPEARAFKAETNKWLMHNTEKWDASVQGFNAILRNHFGLRNVSNLTDEQVPEARELFEQYKQLFQ